MKRSKAIVSLFLIVILSVSIIPFCIFSEDVSDNNDQCYEYLYEEYENVGDYPKPDIMYPYTDVPANKWFASYSLYCFENGYMQGTSSGLFSPTMNITRSMAVTILRAMSCDTDNFSGQPTFDDVIPGRWYFNACEWAYSHHITSGSGEGHFSPDRTITRQDFILMIYKYTQEYSCSIQNPDPTEKTLDSFPDCKDTSTYAVEAMEWAVQYGLLSGNELGYVLPKNTLTRSEAATITYRFDSLFGHVWEISEVVTERNCTQDGLILYNCKNCSIPHAVTLPGYHTWYLKRNIKLPTCTANGSDEYACVQCDQTTEETVSALGHNYVYNRISVEPTCENSGTKEYKCTRCSSLKNESTPALGHNFSYTKTVKPTHSAQGYDVYTCGRCSTTQYKNYTAILQNTVGYDGNGDGKLTIDEYFGAYDLAEFLEKHSSDYLGTPYQSVRLNLSTPWNLLHDKGEYPGDPRMNCTGFVASVIKRCGGNLSLLLNTNNGSYANGFNWKNTIDKKGIYHYRYTSISAALSSGKLKKGDILWFSTSDGDCHLGFFWGDYSSHDRFWHSIPKNSFTASYGITGSMNQISRIVPGNASCNYVYVLPMQGE